MIKLFGAQKFGATLFRGFAKSILNSVNYPIFLLETKVINYGTEVYGCISVPHSWAYNFRNSLEQYVESKDGKHILPREEPLRSRGIKIIGGSSIDGTLIDTYHVQGCTMIGIIEDLPVGRDEPKREYQIEITGEQRKVRLVEREIRELIQTTRPKRNYPSLVDGSLMI